MTDVDAVLAANAAFYQAFESLELARMEAVWLHVPYIKCVHPGWGLLVGWGPVMASWERIFANTLEMRFTLGEPQVAVNGDLAWVLVTENLVTRHREGEVEGQMQATNVFERRDGRWLLVHHHASPVYAPQDAPARVH